MLRPYPAVEVTGLRKRYDDVVAIDGVDLRVEMGECVGILGPNGAGKTTLLEMIEGLRRPDSGEIRVLGEAPWPRNARLLPRIGVQLQATAFIAKLTAVEQLRAFADLYGTPRSRADELLDLIGLGSKADAVVDQLSGGQQQRLSIACALVHRPELVFLDEPSAGLDPAARRNLWDVVAAVRRDGTTVVLTTHHMDEAEALCDRVAILDSGRILAMDTPPGLIRALDAPSRVILPPGALDPAVAATLDGVDAVALDTGALTLTTRDPATLLGGLAALDALEGLQVRSATLEDVFLSMTGRRLIDDDEPAAAGVGGRRPETA